MVVVYRQKGAMDSIKIVKISITSESGVGGNKNFFYNIN